MIPGLVNRKALTTTTPVLSGHRGRDPVVLWTSISDRRCRLCLHPSLVEGTITSRKLCPSISYNLSLRTSLKNWHPGSCGSPNLPHLQHSRNYSPCSPLLSGSKTQPLLLTGARDPSCPLTGAVCRMSLCAHHWPAPTGMPERQEVVLPLWSSHSGQKMRDTICTATAQLPTSNLNSL